MKINSNKAFTFLLLIYSILRKSDCFFRYVKTKGKLLRRFLTVDFYSFFFLYLAKDNSIRERLLNNDYFKIRSLDSSNNQNTLPMIIQIEATIENSFINLTLYQILENDNQSKDDQVLFMDNPNSNTEMKSAGKLVRIKY
jgi:hypothetical protein